MVKDDSNYYKKMNIPVRIINNSGGIKETQKTAKRGGFRFFSGKTLNLILILVLLSSQAYLFSAYEAHVINVTAHICRQAEARTPGYWKTHPEVYVNYLPQFLGDCPEDLMIDSTDAGDLIFVNANAEDMRRRLEAHLLAMKFNIVHYGAGGYEYYVESQGENLTIDEIVAWADDLLRDCSAKRKDLEEVKDILDYLNNLHELRACATITQIPVQTFQFMEEEVVVTERVAVPSCEEESQQPCFTSLLGICSVGVQTCTADGNWGECIQSNQPIDEICDNQLDDNCDGLTDCEDEFCTEGLSCQAEPTTGCEPDTTQSCYTDQLGVCAAGTQTCSTDGLWGECIQGNQPTDEICDDSLDNNCDGLVDCDDVFCAENEVCLLPAPEESTPPAGCTADETQPCETEQLGICAAGTQTCDENDSWGECIQNNQPVDEICDNQLDDNCDGLMDCDDSVCAENPSCQSSAPPTECTIDETQPCETGQSGICATGTKTCNVDGFWGECIQDNQPTDEICDDGLDNNCDGLIDCDDSVCVENPSCQPSECTADETQSCETGQLGICVAGTKTCSAEGFWGECLQDNQPTDEICSNALDDNCDGNIDCGDSSCLEDESCLPPAE